MEALLYYFLKVILCSGVMFLYYRLSLKDKTFHHYNRFYLLGSVVVSLLLPLLKIDYFTLEVNNDIYLLLNKLQGINYKNTLTNDYIYFRIGYTVLGLGAFYFLVRLLIGVFQIQLLKRKYRKEYYQDISFYQTDLSNAPFSYFRSLFWKESISIDSPVGQQILKHEFIHIEQKHSWDKIFLEIVTALFWFNPIFYFIKKEMHLIHEYLADNKAVKYSDTKAFAQMLLASHFSESSLPATSPFLSSNLKKRIKMLQKPKTKFSYTRRILALPVVFTIGFAYLVNAKNQEIIETNKSISMALKEIKNDTIINGKTPEEIVKQQYKSIENQQNKLKEQQANLDKLSKKAKEKSDELTKIAKEQGTTSQSYKEKAKEIAKLSNEIDGSLSKTTTFTELLNLEVKYDEDGNPIPPRLDKVNGKYTINGVDFDSYLKGKNIKVYFNKNRSSGLDSNSRNLKASEAKLIENVISGLKNDGYKFDAVSVFEEIPQKELTNKEKRAIERAQKQAIKAGAKAKIANLEAEKYRKEAIKLRKEVNYSEMDASQRQASDNPWIIGVKAIAPPVSTLKKDVKIHRFKMDDDKNRIIMNSFKTSPKLFVNGIESNSADIEIDGKKVTDKEFRSLDPNKIESVSVSKTNDESKIIIKTKK